jgi:Patatin-like phospholipase
MTAYSPSRRTALVLTGTGAHGAYHAGVLRALQEAGVKIDLIAGQGIGAGSAALAALDGAARLWDADGLWRSRSARRLYTWRWPLRAAAWIGLVLLTILLTPVFVLLVGLLVYLLGFLFEMLQIEAGRSLVSGYSAWLQVAFAGQNLPTSVPRFAVVALTAMLAVLAIGGVLAGRTIGARRSERGWWWRIMAAPFDAHAAREWFVEAIWELIRGAAPVARPSLGALGRRYAEVLSENLGQPGFRELVIVSTDLDARRDVVASLLAEPYRQRFLAPRPGRDRRAEVLDLAGVSREHVIDVVGAALTPSMACDPHLVTFAPDSFWRGETHRLCDRPGSVERLLEEVAEAGATQVIVVTAVASAAAPHRLKAPRLDLAGRFGEFQSAAESVALRDALEALGARFDSVYVIQPPHNAIGPFDLSGAYDEASDRRQDLSEMMERAYEDAYRQFIEPVIGASGEQLAHAVVGARESKDAGDVDLR